MNACANEAWVVIYRQGKDEALGENKNVSYGHFVYHKFHD